MEKHLEMIEKMKTDRVDDTVEGIRESLKVVKEIENFLVRSIRNVSEAEPEKILNTVFDKIYELGVQGKKIQLFLPMLSNIDNELIKFDKRIFDYCKSTRLGAFIAEKVKKYIDYDKRVGMVMFGIFWVIDGKVYLHRESLNKNDAKNKRIIMADSTLSHLKEWELHQKAYPVDDFATYPRGRIIYDVNRNDHIIYADKCISLEQISKIADLCYIKKYVVAYDEHYRCDKCMDGEE
ncbi:MAG: hypothetical protein J6A96_00445 [Clostridia bacterium]|nr:hypothetical protein [Clostridia bacterium]